MSTPEPSPPVDANPAPWSTHLTNLVTAEISRALARGVWAHKAAAEVEKVIAAHADCRYCQP